MKSPFNSPEGMDNQELDNTGNSDRSADAEREQAAIAKVRSTLMFESFSATQLCLSLRMAIVGPGAEISLPLAVKKAAEGRTAAELKRMRSGLFKFHTITGDYPEARKFLPVRNKEKVSEYLPSMLVSLDQNDLKLAKLIARRCFDRIPLGVASKNLRGHDFIEYGLHVALALFNARIGEREKAIKFWGYTVPLDYLSTEAVVGPAYALVVQALVFVREGVNRLLNQQMNEHFVFGVIPEVDVLERRQAAIDELQEVHRHLTDILPPQQKRSFGVQFSGPRAATNEEGQ